MVEVLTSRTNIELVHIGSSLLWLLAAGTSQSMQGLFSLMMSFESISKPAVQKQLLEHSLQLLQLSRASRVRLLCHKARSAGQLMGLLRDHAPETVQDDHLLMLRGPFQDMVLPSFRRTSRHTDVFLQAMPRQSACNPAECLHHPWLCHNNYISPLQHQACQQMIY